MNRFPHLAFAWAYRQYQRIPTRLTCSQFLSSAQQFSKVATWHSQAFAHAGAHELKERTRVPLQTNLIAYSSHAHEVKEWYYYPEPSVDSKAGSGRTECAEDARAGPLTKDELQMRFAQDKVQRNFFLLEPVIAVVADSRLHSEESAEYAAQLSPC